ncbi:hypothetical protein R1sor_021461 [Riccia sorocarpa]|uniref:Uncharacterized protein n=1 Tax=Riccia sorocarpa TaxID=122646 RepID=A0ABD3GKG7_9MARC
MKRKSTESFSEKEEVFHDDKQLNLSVLWSRKSRSVLYLECGKDFLDILLSIFITPVGAILNMLEEEGLSVDIKHGQFVMYASLMRLEKSILCVNKDILLDPPALLSGSQNYLLLEEPVKHTCVRQNCSNRTNSKRELCSECTVVPVYRCPTCGKKPPGNFTPNVTPRCSVCTVPGGSVMKLHYEIEARPQPPVKANAAKSWKKGYVRKNHTYMLKDDLSFSKCGTMSTVALLQSMKVESFDDLVTREIFVERHEILCLVRAALVSTTPLTDVFGSMFEKKTDLLGTSMVPKTEMLEAPLKLCLGHQADNCDTKENIRTTNLMEQSSDQKVRLESPQVLPTDLVQQSIEQKEEII